MHIGFSTGSIAFSDFRKALELLSDKPTDVIELSALRETEVAGLIAALDEIDLSKYQYISFHAPSKLTIYSEKDVLNMMSRVVEMGWNIIVHPDIIKDFTLWRQLGKCLCIENMDKRKPVGRTNEDMKRLFDIFPEATFCLDLAHARQVDPTMHEAYLMLRDLKEKIVQLHLSDVTTESKHVPLNMEAIDAYVELAYLIPKNIPVILESTVKPDFISREIELAESIFQNSFEVI